MHVVQMPIPGVLKLQPRRFDDHRGRFCETWNRRAFAQSGIDTDFVQDNWSVSRCANTIRGLHLQIGDAAQAKLVRPVRRSIIDVVVDLRPDSPTYGKWLSIPLDTGQGDQLFVPAGLAHGFRTLDSGTEIQYKVSSYYAPDAERGIHWKDADLAIDWGVHEDDAMLSERDEQLTDFRTLLRELSQPMPDAPGPVQTDASWVAQ